MKKSKEQALTWHLLIILSLLLLPSCTSPKKQDPLPGEIPLWLKQDQRPKTVVILPFENKTEEKGLGDLVRETFYGHFSTKNYHDVELSRVDSSLKVFEEQSSRSWKDLPPASLGNLFHADFLIYGKVLKYGEVFAGIYSQIVLEVEVEMVSSRNNEGVWNRTLIERSHEGGVPLDLIGIPMVAARSGYHLRDENTIRLVDHTCRKLVQEIPDPNGPTPSPFLFDVQVASFLEKDRALKTLKGLEMNGHHPRIETVTLGDRQWHRILLGPFSEISAARKIRDRIATQTPLKPILVHHYGKFRDNNKE
ncbi:GNA1162 family protein [Thermodesulfobacteriota bacterium]